MNNKFLKLFGLVLFLAVLAGCKKVENRVYFENGTAPVLTAEGADVIVLNKDNADKDVMSFAWTNPNYSFNTGISSQNVTYLLEFDTTGSNFTHPKLQQYSVINDLQTTLTQGQINTYLLELGLAHGVPHQVEMRLKSVLGTSFAVPLISNVITRTITPYSVEPDLWITGNYNADINWTDSPNENQKFAYDAVSKTLYITVNFEPGREYKFLAKHGQWQPQYGGAPATGGTLTVNMESGGTDPAPMITPSVAGSYKLTVDLENMTLKVEKV